MTARTSKAWGPSVSPETFRGDSQGWKAPTSTRHWKVPPGSLDEKEKVASREAVAPSGPSSMAVSGSVVFTWGLNQGSAPMSLKAWRAESEVSIRQS